MLMLTPCQVRKQSRNERLDQSVKQVVYDSTAAVRDAFHALAVRAVAISSRVWASPRCRSEVPESASLVLAWVSAARS
jgi:hypothetical protein